MYSHILAYYFYIGEKMTFPRWYEYARAYAAEQYINTYIDQYHRS